MQPALRHQVLADIGADAGLEQHVVGQHHGGASPVLQAADEVLHEGQLLVTGLEGEVIPRGATATLGAAEGWVAQDHVGVLQGLALRAQGVSQSHGTFAGAKDVVQHAVHQGQSPGGGYKFHADEGLFSLELLLLSAKVEQIVGAVADVAVSGD